MPSRKETKETSVATGALAAAYIAGAMLGFALTYDEWTSTLWPPSGIALAGLLLWGNRVWPGITAGALVSNTIGLLDHGFPLAPSLASAALIAAGNTLQALAGASLIRRFSAPEEIFQRARGTLAFVLLGVLLAPLISASAGPLVLYAGGYAGWDRLPALAGSWWLGNAMGVLIFAPLVLIWRRPPAMSGARWAELTVLLLSLVVMSMLTFGAWLSVPSAPFSVVHVPFPLLGWSVLRFGEHGAALANPILVLSAIAGTAHQSGPFAMAPAMRSIVLLQTCGGFVAATTLVLAAVLAERTRSEGDLRAMRDTLARRSTRLEALSERLRGTREEEAARVAREVHEEIGQALGALKMHVAWLARRLAADEEAQAKTAAMAALIDAMIGRTRRIAGELRPSLLDHLGLGAALESELLRFEEKTGATGRLVVIPEDLEIDAERSIALFRLVQEALTNVARHAGASQVRITLRGSAQAIRLQITDNGRGIDRAAPEKLNALGLMGIRERVARWKGEVWIRGLRGIGTSLRVTLPIDGPGGNRPKSDAS